MAHKNKAATLSGAARSTNFSPEFISKKASAQQYLELRQELTDAGIKVNSTESDSQLLRLGAVLEYLGSRGLNTYEGEVAGGFARIATRIHNLREDGWQIQTARETAAGPDGLMHIGVARYFLISKPVMGECDSASKPRRSYRHMANVWERFNTFRAEWLAKNPNSTSQQFDAALLNQITAPGNDNAVSSK